MVVLNSAVVVAVGVAAVAFVTVAGAVVVGRLTVITFCSCSNNQ